MSVSRYFTTTTNAAARASSYITQWQRASGCRRAHQAATAVEEVPYVESGVDTIPRLSLRPVSQFGLLPVRGRRKVQGIAKVQELRRKVQALEEAIKVDSLAFTPLTYSEEELVTIYEDLLSFHSPEPKSDEGASIEKARSDNDRQVVEALEKRLFGEVQGENFSYRRILTRVHEIISGAKAARQAVQDVSSLPKHKAMSLGVLSLAECEVLVRMAIKSGNAQVAQAFLEIIREDNMTLPEDSTTNLLRLYSDQGNIQAADYLLENLLTETPTDAQRHLHVRTHLRAAPPDSIPTSALNLLHHYEQQNVPAPMQTYTSVITSLFSCSSSVARAQAWDIFTHMRYVAHPNPDVVLYTLMIRACASPITPRYSSEPEKALDLWTEMTVEQNIAPTLGAYNAVILACARSGSKTYVNEAFRLARQMLDSHRDARGHSPFRPDKKTFCALLEGAKRIGDLGRARWILAEMVKGRGDCAKKVEAEIDEEVMMHLFNAYAAYNVPFVRTSTRSVNGASMVSRQGQTVPETSEITVRLLPENSGSQPVNSSNPSEDTGQRPSFSHLPPQTRGEVIREVQFLFQRIQQDRTDTPTTASSSLPFMEKKFRKVELTTRLLTAYLSVFYKHADLSVARELFWKLFEDVRVTWSARTCLEALDRCANTKRKSERSTALQFADELWLKWNEIEEAGNVDGRALNPRLVERAHVAMIRTLAVNDNISRAMALLRAFATKYPPNILRTPSPKLPFRSTRTSLIGARPLVRMTSAADMVDDNVPPLITFRDVEILHHRLIDEGMNKDIKYVTWLCKAYEWALRVRRDEAVKAKPLDGNKILITP